MKHFYLLLVASIAAAGSAVAADMPLKAPVYAPPPPTWTGCYIGAEGGGNWGTSSVFDLRLDRPQTDNFSLHGGLGGGTVGCNWQFASSWMIGIEDDMSLSGKHGAAPDNRVPTTINNVTESWIDTLRGRLGYVWGQWLFYGTGGAAFADGGVQVCSTINGGCSNMIFDSRTGWAAGGGIEWAFAPQWSVKVEYIHADFGTADYFFNNGGTDARRVLLRDDIVRAGVNLRFN